MSEATAAFDKFFVEDILEEVHALYVKEHPNAFDDIVDDVYVEENKLITKVVFGAGAARGLAGKKVGGAYLAYPDKPLLIWCLQKNPLRVSLDALYLERTQRKRIKNGAKHFNKDGSVNYRMNYKRETEIIPALDERWLAPCELRVYGHYQPYYPQFSKEENLMFRVKNAGFVQTLETLLKYNFQKFWCVMVFSRPIMAALRKFVGDFVYSFDYKCLDREERNIYAMILIRVLHVYQRMFRFKESEFEYLSEEVGMNYLISNQHLTTPIIMRLAMLFIYIDENFVKKIVRLYYAPRFKSTYTKELREALLNIKTLMETIEYVVTESKPSSTPSIKAGCTEVRTKPAQFDPHWAQEIVAHVLDCFYSLSSFLPLLDEAIEIAIELEIPVLIPMVYEKVFKGLEAYMTDRASVTDELRSNIQNYTEVARSEAVKSFEAIVSYCIRRIMETANDSKDQENLVEMYLEWMQESLGCHLFILHYNYYCSIGLQLDQISTFCPKIEELRVKYIKASVDTIEFNEAEKKSTVSLEERLKNCKFSDFWSAIWDDVVVSEPPSDFDMEELERRWEGEDYNEGGESQDTNNEHKEDTNEEVEEMIRSIMETLPHLGDGFILQCLEHYQYNVTDTLAAILDENLPPHLAEIPFDTPRIPEETEPQEEPFLAHRGKREDYKDAMQLLDDKNAIKDIKNLIITNSTVQDESDDDFDDRTQYDPVLPDNDDAGEERLLRHMAAGIKNLTVASGSSDDSEEEASARRPPGAFCEDPAVIRARREAQQRGKGGKGRSFDVVGKPKGQGQEKDVLHNRDKKNVNKSSRANHNRKKGAQWKRSRGMI